MYTVTFKTLGCKLNQAETAMMIQDFIDHGYVPVANKTGADISVVNTCTVTGRSDAKCRQAIRQLLHANPDTTLIVAGCYSQVAAEEIVQMTGVDYVLGTQEKLQLFEVFPGPGKRALPLVSVSGLNKKGKIDSQGIGQFEKTRAALRIQNGCDNHCTYCIVPIARGPGFSVPFHIVIDQAKRLAKRDYKEIVLTGVHIGEYGREWSKKPGLSELLHELGRIDGLSRIRLSSLEPENITNALIEEIKVNKKVCRHFHLSLQSGSAEILKQMKRKSSLSTIEKALGLILQAFPCPGLGTDIIVGFPGETDGHFNETRDLLVKTPFSYFHVFPFSKRPGTAAADFPKQIPARIRMERAKNLRALGCEKALAFRKKWLGRQVDVLFESKNHHGWMSGWTSEYLRVEAPCHLKWMNQIVNVTLSRLTDHGMQADG